MKAHVLEGILKRIPAETEISIQLSDEEFRDIDMVQILYKWPDKARGYI